MLNRKAVYGILLALLALSAVLGFIVFYAERNQDLKVIFFNVGQGDAILIIQGQNQMLIDGGKDGKIILEKLGKYVPFWDRTLEVVVATHPDQDHIGGLIDILKAYQVRNILETNARSDSQTYAAWEESIEKENVPRIEAQKGITLKFTDSTEADVVYPFSAINSASQSSSNQYSVVIKLKSESGIFLLTGDLPAEQEADLIQHNTDVKADILKVAHHGSKYSTSEEFLEAVDPEEAIISVGKNNSYGHPSPEILDRLLKYRIKIYRTDELGDIVYKCRISSQGGSASDRLDSKCKIYFE